MTVAQYKIRRYMKHNNIGFNKLSKNLGYSETYLYYIANGRIPKPQERETIGEFFNIVDESEKIPIMIKDKYGFISNTYRMYNFIADDHACYMTVRRWYRGILPRDKTRLKVLCKMLDVKNEWVEEFDIR